jgi:hypothetical protein
VMAGAAVETGVIAPFARENISESPPADQRLGHALWLGGLCVLHAAPAVRMASAPVRDAGGSETGAWNGR